MPRKKTRAVTPWKLQKGEIANIGKNISKVIKAMGISQAQFASKMEVSTGTLSSYINGGAYPPLVFIAKMCVTADIQKAISFTADEFLFETLQFNDGKTGIEEKKVNPHKDMLGDYFLYFFDQTSSDSIGKIDSGRKLRYGVISLYERTERLGEIKVYAYALFFKTLEDAENHWSKLPAKSANDRTAELGALYKADKEHYIGEVTFNGGHAFIDLTSDFYRDKGLVILNAPDKKPNSDYIGGLGNVLSVSHGSAHSSVAQKIIFSKAQLKNVSEEEIAKHLSLTSTTASVIDETDEIINVFKNLYPNTSGDAIVSIDKWFDAQDKKAIFCNRLSRLLQNRAKKEYNSLCMISKTDDHAVYKLIRRCIDSQT